MPLISPSHVIAYIAACVENDGTHVAAPTGPYSFHLAGRYLSSPPASSWPIRNRPFCAALSAND